jgi:hypothetical protein
VIPRALLLSLAFLAACGGTDEDDPAPVSPEAVVRGWAADLRRGDIDAATDRFAVPAIVANGAPEERLETRLQVRSFNEDLPCGGRVTATRRHHGLVIATFVLTSRPGARCDGTGGTARTAFEVRDGKIVRWLRVPSAGDAEGGEAPGPVV